MRKTYGAAVRRGFCSVECTSGDEDARDVAAKIADDLFVEGFLSEEDVGRPENFSRIVKTISKRIKT